MRSDWQFVMIGPVVKIDEATLPRLPNIHWLGCKPYSDLPRYLAGWNVGLMPFALNASTRFISPTKTPEFLAAGVPVVCSPIPDVVRCYGDPGLVPAFNAAPRWTSRSGWSVACPSRSAMLRRRRAPAMRTSALCASASLRDRRRARGRRPRTAALRVSGGACAAAAVVHRTHLLPHPQAPALAARGSAGLR